VDGGEGRRECDIGIVGLAVMGRNLALNMADHGFAVAAFNRIYEVTREFAASLRPEQAVQPCATYQELATALKRPRLVTLMVKAGQPVDAVIAELLPWLEPGDIVIDGGNSHFTDTERRQQALAVKGIHLLGVGISGGEQGARYGPSLMPGGPKQAYDSVAPIFEAVAARADGRPCVAYLGPGVSGHYVKMVHNGIEYGLMQLLAETYALMKRVLGLSNEDMAAVYAGWNAGDLQGYLVEITAKILTRRDDKTGGYLIDVIKGAAEQLGTGMWTSQSAMDMRVPVPNIDTAVSARDLSDWEEQRRAAAQASAQAAPAAAPGGVAPHAAALAVDDVREAFHAAMVVTYAQGFALLQAASQALGLGLRLQDVAAVWRGGCIIRSALLKELRAAYERRPDLSNPLLDPELLRAAAARRARLAATVQAAVAAGVAVPGLMAALAYLDAYQTEWSPANLIQAQRDCFGAHTYQRTDQPGVFHTDWLGGS
jgi:6-phosphogluconate dehydrogenase